MKPNREASERIMAIIEEASKYIRPADSCKTYRELLLNLASELIPTDDTYGHAKRIHDLTGGNEQ